MTLFHSLSIHSVDPRKARWLEGRIGQNFPFFEEIGTRWPGGLALNSEGGFVDNRFDSTDRRIIGDTGVSSHNQSAAPDLFEPRC